MSHRINRTVQPQRQADFYYSCQHCLIQPFGKQGKAQLRILPSYISHTEQPGAIHGEHCCQRRSRHIHAQPCHKQQIQRNIHGTGDKQEKQGCPAITDSPQNTSIHIIAHVSQSSDKNNSDIRIGKVPGIGRHLHDFQHKRPCKLSDHRQWNGTYV